MSAQAVTAAFLALFPAGVTKHDGQVPSPAVFPYCVVSVQMPTAAGRAISYDRHGGIVRARVTVAAGTAAGVRIISDLLEPLDGARPVAAGYSFGRVALVNAREPQEDRDITIPNTNRHPMYAVLEYEFTVSPTS